MINYIHSSTLIRPQVTLLWTGHSLVLGFPEVQYCFLWCPSQVSWYWKKKTKVERPKQVRVIPKKWYDLCTVDVMFLTKLTLACLGHRSCVLCSLEPHKELPKILLTSYLMHGQVSTRNFKCLVFDSSGWPDTITLRNQLVKWELGPRIY